MKPAGTISLPGWLICSQTQILLNSVPNAYETVKFVGGCVRDTLLGLEVKDIDIATTYQPKEMINFIQESGHKVIPTGIEHGSILAIIDSKSYEITTLRKDLQTDGRYAKIAYTDDWLEDAKRRDFTINALYLSTKGELFDPWGGHLDLLNGYIKFIGDPHQRVQEDYLRILRYFRFLAYYSNNNLDNLSFEACIRFSSALQTLSSERVHRELMKILSAPNPVFAVIKMHEARIFETLFHQVTINDIDLLERLIELEGYFMKDKPVNPLLRLFSLSKILNIDLLNQSHIFKFSKREKQYFNFLKAALANASLPDDLLLYYYPASIVIDCRLIESSLINNMKKLEDLFQLLKLWVKPSFPLKGFDLINLGIDPGIKVGKYLKEIEKWWIENNLKPTYQECLNELKQRISS